VRTAQLVLNVVKLFAGPIVIAAKLKLCHDRVELEAEHDPLVLRVVLEHLQKVLLVSLLNNLA